MFDMDLLINRIKAYAKRAGIAETTASFRVFGDGNRLTGLKEGKSLTVKSANKAFRKLDKLEHELSSQEAA